MTDVYQEVREDLQIARAKRGTDKDDEKTDDDWGASLRVILTTTRYTKRHMWIKVAALAVRAVGAIDRKVPPRHCGKCLAMLSASDAGYDYCASCVRREPEPVPPDRACRNCGAYTTTGYCSSRCQQEFTDL